LTEIEGAALGPALGPALMVGARLGTALGGALGTSLGDDDGTVLLDGADVNVTDASCAKTEMRDDLKIKANERKKESFMLTDVCYLILI
jgi:phage tail tape-measure protein